MTADTHGAAEASGNKGDKPGHFCVLSTQRLPDTGYTSIKNYHMYSTINKAFLKLRKRAESADRSKLIETFVDVGALFTLLSNPEHQILYGRRGTGKTHAMIYLSESVRQAGDISVYIDLRNIGSTGGIYGSQAVPLHERSTRLLSDTIAAIHEELLAYCVDNAEAVNLASMGPILDELADGITEVEVVGEIETEESRGREDTSTSHTGSHFGISPSGPELRINGQEEIANRSRREQKVVRKGQTRHRVHFGRVGGAVQKLARELSPRRIWLMLDEWSSIPIELQPYLADLLRRSVLPVQGLVVKIAAIEQRTEFRIAGDRGDYVGIELGADAAADLNLDDYMVFDNDEEKATGFFQDLVFKHFESIDIEDRQELPSTPEDLVRAAFTQLNTFKEFVRSAEGVPRDAIYILAQAAQKDINTAISVDNIRSAARSWYQRDKEDAVSANKEARALLHWVIDEVIGHRQARAFLLTSNTRHGLIDTLYDARVLHLLKKNISSRDEPGVRYDAYKLDYGCYVDLLTTTRAPQGMLFAQDNMTWFVDVPRDDYRAIRRAILDLNVFEKQVLERM